VKLVFQSFVFDLTSLAVGKSSIILRFVTNTFSEAYGVTIGGAFMAKLLIHNGVSTKFKVNPNLWLVVILADLGYSW